MVEVWPYSERSRGIAVFQLFGRLASFFTTYVNPIGIKDVGWKYLISYCAWLAYEVVFVYFFFPETFGRTLEELAFSKYPSPLLCHLTVTVTNLAFVQCSRTESSPTRLLLPSKRLCTTGTMAIPETRTPETLGILDKISRREELWSTEGRLRRRSMPCKGVNLCFGVLG